MVREWCYVRGVCVCVCVCVWSVCCVVSICVMCGWCVCLFLVCMWCVCVVFFIELSMPHYRWDILHAELYMVCTSGKHSTL